MILYQICHYCKHVGNYIFYNDDKLGVKPRDLHEIALLIEKYSEVIDWSQIIKNAVEWNLLGSVNLCFTLIESLYPDLLDRELVSSVRKLTAEVSDRNSHNAVIDDISFLPAEKILNLDFKDVIYNGRINSDLPLFKASQKVSQSSNIEMYYQTNKTETRCCWDSRCFSAKTKIKFQDSEGIKSFSSAMFTIGCQTCHSGCQSFIVEKGKRRYILKNEWSEPINSELVSFSSNYDSLNNELCIKLSIDWEYLNIEPQTNLNLPFNLKIYFKDMSKCIQVKPLAGSKYFNFYNNRGVRLIP